MMVIKSEKLRNILKYLIPFIIIPVIVILGATVFDDKRYSFISLSIVIMSLLLFMSSYEKKSTGTRRMIIVAVMIALCVIGRFIPILKPVTAIIIITSMYVGRESGFLVGSLSAVLSNFYFGQGPWTPFQMFAWGMIGLVAGFLGEYLKKNKPLLIVFALFSGVLYSFIMDVWTVLWYNNSFDLKLYLAALLSAIPYTVSYALSNLIFILVLAKPFGEKFERVKLKYGV